MIFGYFTTISAKFYYQGIFCLIRYRILTKIKIFAVKFAFGFCNNRWSSVQIVLTISVCHWNGMAAHTF